MEMGCELSITECEGQVALYARRQQNVANRERLLRDAQAAKDHVSEPPVDVTDQAQNAAMVDDRLQTRSRRGNVRQSPVRSSPRKKQKAAHQFNMGDRVLAVFEAHKGNTDKYEGTINKLNGNGTFGICYIDGDYEAKVLPKHIFCAHTNILDPDPAS